MKGRMCPPKKNGNLPQGSRGPGGPARMCWETLWEKADNLKACLHGTLGEGSF